MANSDKETAEERILNIWTHGVGIAFGAVVLTLLVVYSIRFCSLGNGVCFIFYGVCFALLYIISTLYHVIREKKLKRFFMILDHVSIALFIAASYTPFMIVALGGTEGWSVFAAVWAMTIFAIIFKFFYQDRRPIVTTTVYALMGWLVILVAWPLSQVLTPYGTLFLALGGLFYTFGIIFYALRGLKYNHAFFHVMVLAGSICHFISVFLYILPRSGV